MKKGVTRAMYLEKKRLEDLEQFNQKNAANNFNKMQERATEQIERIKISLEKQNITADELEILRAEA